MSPSSETPILAKPEAILRVPVGLSSPLWAFFAGAAVGGTAWWWMTRWARPQNLEAMFGRATPAEAEVVEAEVVALEGPEAATQAAPEMASEVGLGAEPILEAFIEAEAAAEAVIDPPSLDAPVGGEAAPVAPALAAEASEPASAPKPRTRKAEVKSD